MALLTKNHLGSSQNDLEQRIMLFAAGISNAAGNSYSIKFHETDPGFNIYDQADTTTRWDNEENFDADDDQVVIGYYRDSYPTDDSRGVGYGGRGETNSSATLSGDGILSARVFIDENTLESSGVTTIAVLADEDDSSAFDINYEFDLAVWNLDNGEDGQEFRWGWANHSTTGVPLSEMVGEWLTIEATLVDDPDYDDPHRRHAYIEIERESTGDVIFLDDGDGNVAPQDINWPDADGDGPKEGRLVINSRARGTESVPEYSDPSDDRATATIDFVKWQSLE